MPRYYWSGTCGRIWNLKHTMVLQEIRDEEELEKQTTQTEKGPPDFSIKEIQFPRNHDGSEGGQLRWS